MSAAVPPPSPAARLALFGLPWVFLAFWAGLLSFLTRVLDHLVPACLALDPASLLLGLTLAPQALYLAQALFYLPPPPSGPPVFLRSGLFGGPLVCLPVPGRPRLLAGPAFFAAATAGDQARLLAAAEDRLRRPGRLAARLSFLLNARTPLDQGLAWLAARARLPFSLPARGLNLLFGPARQLTRLWGYLFFLAWRAWADPGPVDELTAYKRNLAWDLVRPRPLPALAPGEAGPEPEAGESRRLSAARAGLARIHGRPDYGARLGEPLPAPVLPESALLEPAPWLNPVYQGVFLDLPVTLYADSPARLYAEGRPEKDLSLFYPPELAWEMEDAAALEAELDYLAGLLAAQTTEGLVWADGRLCFTWQLAARRRDLEDSRDRLRRRAAVHHARCRAAHLAAAGELGPGWPEALRGWGALLGLAEHGRQALNQAREDFLAGGAGPGRTKAGQKLKAAEAAAAVQAFQAGLDDLRQRLADLGLGLGQALPQGDDPAILKEKYPAFCLSLHRDLAGLRDRALTGLLAAEARVAALTGAGGGPAGPIPAELVPPSIPDDWPVIPAGARPPLPRVPSPADRLKVGAGRSALAVLVLALLSWQGLAAGLSQVSVYNGLETAVTVTAAGRELTVPPFGRRSLKLQPGREYEFAAGGGGRRLENFRQRLAPRPASEIYNVAGAAPLMEWWFPRAAQPGGSLEIFLGRPRWLVTRATVIFEQPSGDRRALVLSGYGDSSPAEILAAFPDEDERGELARLHFRHTPPGSPRFWAWLALMGEGDQLELLWERQAREPALMLLAVRGVGRQSAK